MNQPEPSSQHAKPKILRAFTLIELLVVLGIVGVLSSIGYSMYVDKVKAGYRSEAQSALLQLQQAMERFYTENNTYEGTQSGGKPKSDLFPAQAPLNSSEPKYNLGITAATSSYTLSATPINDTLMANDGIYTLSNTGEKTYQGENGWD